MPVQRRRSLRSVQSSFLEHGLPFEREADASSTGTVQIHPQRSLSFASTELEKLPLTIRNRNTSESVSLSPSFSPRKQYSDSGQGEVSKPRVEVNIRTGARKSKSVSALDDPNINFAVVDSIRLAQQKALPAIPAVQDKLNNENQKPRNPLQRWVRTLHRRNVKRQNALRPREERWSLDEFDETQAVHGGKENTKYGKGHKKSSSWASSGFVTAVKSATVSLTTMSIAPPPSKGCSSVAIRGSEQGSRRSPSLDHSTCSVHPNGQRIVDEASLERAYRRRSIIQEIVRTEEGYVADLRLLIDVYRTLSAKTSIINTTRIVRNINEILNLHEVLLFSIRPILAFSGLMPDHQNFLQVPCAQSDTQSRSQSVDSPGGRVDRVARPSAKRSLEIVKKRRKQDDRIMADPDNAAQVARAFNDLIGHFFVYEEYGSRFTTMMNQMALAERYHDIDSYEKGFEALANTIAPCSSREANRRKGLTYRDLLMKPVQRITRYPLLFSDLLGQTPVIDCPESCGEVEKALYRLRETVDEINKATNDEYAHEKIQRSWRLQDMIVFGDRVSAPYVIRALGHSKLCGALHAAYQSPVGIVGEYMLCALFRSCLILAKRPKEGERRKPFEIVASISLANLEVHNCDNGVGLQCYTALHSWKVVFEADHHLNEIILSACSRQEEIQWRTLVKYHADKETRIIYQDDPRAPEQYSRLFFRPSIQPFAEAFGCPGTLARRLSARRPATVGPRTALSQVVIRNTHSLRSSEKVSRDLSMGRSQTVHHGPRIQTLAPRRLDRIHIEQDLSDVWTKDLLPYPGMSSRGESQIRASATTVIRRLSRATSNSFGKRSVSFTGRLDEALADEDPDLSPILESRGILLPLAESPRGPSIADSEALFRSNSQAVFSTSGEAAAPDVAGSPSDSTPKGNDRERPPRHLRQRLNSSLSLIRTMSIEGMKAVFSHGHREYQKDASSPRKSIESGNSR